MIYYKLLIKTVTLPTESLDFERDSFLSIIYLKKICITCFESVCPYTQTTWYQSNIHAHLFTISRQFDLSNIGGLNNINYGCNSLKGHIVHAGSLPWLKLIMMLYVTPVICFLAN